MSYIGYEPGATYVEHGRWGDTDRDVTLHSDLFDFTIVGAVLHHMDDALAGDLFPMLARFTHPSGRVLHTVCVSCTFWIMECQHPLEQAQGAAN